MHHLQDRLKNTQANNQGKQIKYFKAVQVLRFVSSFRPKSNESLDNMDQMHPNSSSSSGQQNISTPTPSNESQNFLPAHLKYTTPDQNSNPIPPYMPIQGVRRNGNVQSDKKKKPKDNRCTHQ